VKQKVNRAHETTEPLTLQSGPAKRMATT
jgi:hypothetical protein